jgi:hypothetical protein
VCRDETRADGDRADGDPANDDRAYAVGESPDPGRQPVVHGACEMKARASGWKAIVLIVVVLGAGAYRLASARSSLSSEGAEVLKDWVSTEYQRHYLAQTEWSDEEKAKYLLEVADIEFRSVSAKGSGDDIIVRVEIEPSPYHPPGAKTVRYFRMEHSLATGWRYRSDASAFSYYLKSF